VSVWALKRPHVRLFGPSLRTEPSSPKVKVNYQEKELYHVTRTKEDRKSVRELATIKVHGISFMLLIVDCYFIVALMRYIWSLR
jgi:1,2-phenylacetyl-CoA epoxidase PaaB subunit